MAMAVVYTQFCGMLVHETRSGSDSEYVPDPLGSTAALMNSAQTITDSWEYWPYGETMSRTGTNPTPFTYVGLLGYFQEILDKLMYIRARWYQPGFGRWTTVDPLWPDESAYGYAGAAPAQAVDWSGLRPQIKTCEALYADCLRCVDFIVRRVTAGYALTVVGGAVFAACILSGLKLVGAGGIGGIGGGLIGGSGGAAAQDEIRELKDKLLELCKAFKEDCPNNPATMCGALARKRCRHLSGTAYEECRVRERDRCLQDELSIWFPVIRPGKIPPFLYRNCAGLKDR